MAGDILLGGVEDLRHLQLCQPDCLLCPQLDLAAVVIGRVGDEAVKGVGRAALWRIVFVTPRN